MGAPGSFAQRRPHAGNLPNFELPPPNAQSQPKYSYAHGYNGQAPTSLASVGNLLTPPSTVSGETAGVPSGHPTSAVPYSNGAYAWSPQVQTQPSYGYATAPQTHNARGPYSPLSAVVSSGQIPPSPATTDSQSGQQYNLPPFASSGPMSAPPTLSSMPMHQPQAQPAHSHHALMASQAPDMKSLQPSPVQSQEGFRPPHTPSYYSQPPHSAQQSAYPYSTGPSPTQTHPSPLSAGPLSSRPAISPANGGPVTSMPPVQQVHSPHPYQQQRFATFPGANGPVISNMSNPHGQTMLLGALPHAMMPGGFNSGHAATLQHMYGAPHPTPTPHNDRPFKCDQCPQSFNRNHDLKRHKRIHLAVKPFPCGHCDKSFSRKDALKVCPFSALKTHQ